MFDQLQCPVKFEEHSDSLKLCYAHNFGRERSQDEAQGKQRASLSSTGARASSASCA
ncbi:hypothetical protein PF004_g15777, partial [Phytophthora fragariae]